MQSGLMVGVLMIAAIPGHGLAQTIDLPRIAVVGFEARPGGWTLPPPRVGEIVSQLMMDKLVEASQLHVFDGQWLRGAPIDDPRRAQDALLEGARQAGVDYVVVGSITQFSMEQRQRTIGGGGFLRGLPAGAGSRRQTSELSVSILARIVNVHSGEVMATATGTGVGKRSGVSAAGLLGLLPVVGGFSRSATNSRDAQLDEATRQAVAAAAAALVNAVPRLAVAHTGGQ